MTGRLLCFGLGYTGLALARRLAPRGWEVRGTSRDGRRIDGIETTRLDDADLDGVTHVLASIPPEADGDPVLRRHRAGLTTMKWVGYLSTTGVYGDHGGAQVDETMDPTPLTDRAKRRVAAEAEWISLGNAEIFRLAGIYGPGRNVVEDLRAGTARRIVKPGQVFSRIHVEDIAAVLASAIERPSPGAIYNVADDEPVSSETVLVYAASRLGIEPPPPIAWDSPGLSEMVRSFYAENRRVSNAKIRRDLGVRLAYPTYREAIDSFLAS
jgi:nucleoside-diphosphate-sugar epimerase